MTSMQSILNMPKVLAENLKTIRDELGLAWPHFQRELAPLLKHFTHATDNEALETTVNEVWQVCCHYPFVKGLILGYSLGDNAEPSPRRWRKLEAAQFGAGLFEDDEEFVREIINRFQSLSNSLKKVERPEEEAQDVAKQERKPIRYRGG